MIYAVEKHDSEDGVLRLTPPPAAKTPQEAAILEAYYTALPMTPALAMEVAS